MKNVSLISDDIYLLYWIYDGRGEFGDALDTVKYLDDPQLIMYGLIQKIEATKNDPDLDGEERDEEIKSLKDELKDFGKNIIWKKMRMKSPNLPKMMNKMQKNPMTMIQMMISQIKMNQTMMKNLLM